jgi:hypothetical protein
LPEAARILGAVIAMTAPSFVDADAISLRPDQPL